MELKVPVERCRVQGGGGVGGVGVGGAGVMCAMGGPASSGISCG